MKKTLGLLLALVMVLGLFTASTALAEDPVNIVWLIRADKPTNFDSVMAKVNEKLKADMNMTLTMDFIAPGDFPTKIEIAMAGGDEWDLCFTSNWANIYTTDVGKGAFLELDALLPTLAPDVMKEIPESFWDGVKVNGHIYGMINYQVMFDQPGLQLLKSEMDEMGVDPASIKSWADLTALYAKMQEKYPDKYATRGGGVMSVQTFQPAVISTLGANYLGYNPETKKVEPAYQFEKAAEAYAAYYEWNQKKYQPADAATTKDEATLLKQGMLGSRYQRYKPGAATQVKNNTGLEWYIVPTGVATVGTAAVQSTLTAVNANSKHPEEAIKLYNYFFSNADAYNLLIYGIEGQDYKNVDGKFERIPDGYTAPAWQLGNQFNALVNVKDDNDIWEMTKKGNAEAALDPVYGFVLDRTPIETEMATCDAIWVEYKDILGYGLQDPKVAVPEMLDKMNKGGLEKVVAEVQKQLDAFFAAKGM